MKKLFVLPLLVMGLGSGLPLTAQTFKTLHDFPQWDGPLGGPYINSDGGKPEVALIMSGGTLYGTTAFAGSSGNGTLFALNTDGTGFTVLYNFGDTDGAGAYGSLILSGHTFYGQGRQEAVRVPARCSPSIPMERGSRLYMHSLAATTELNPVLG
jgi:uncharacterized repeat protein (TIGR03803 family)